MEENTGLNTDKRLDNLKPAWKKGDPSPNPAGRPKGRKNFSTLYYEALEHLARLNNTTADALELEMHANALKKARAGDFAFYRDTLDRLHGKPQERVNMSVEYPQPLLGGQSIVNGNTTNNSNEEVTEPQEEN